MFLVVELHYHLLTRHPLCTFFFRLYGESGNLLDAHLWEVTVVVIQEVLLSSLNIAVSVSVYTSSKTWEKSSQLFIGVPLRSHRRHLVLKCQITLLSDWNDFSCDYAPFPPVSSKKNNQNVLIGLGDWRDTSVFYVSDFQMSFQKDMLSLWHWGFWEGGGGCWRRLKLKWCTVPPRCGWSSQ